MTSAMRLRSPCLPSLQARSTPGFSPPAPNVVSLTATRGPASLGHHNKYHGRVGRGGGLKLRNGLSHGSGGWMSKIKVSAGARPPAASLLGLQGGAFTLCPPREHIPAVSSSS